MTRQTVVIVFCVICLGVTMIVVERLRPGHKFPKVRGWLARAIAINAFRVVAVYLAGLLWNSWMVDPRPWRADRLGTFARIPLKSLRLPLLAQRVADDAPLTFIV
jgi:hypothetical protein